MSRSISQPGRLPASTGVRLPARMARAMLHTSLRRLERGSVTLHDVTDGPTAVFGAGEPRAEVRVLDPRAYGAIAFGGSVGAGEAFVERLWDADAEDLVRLVRLLAVNRESLAAMDGAIGRLLSPLRRAAYAMQANTLAGSRRNIAAHYDLSNDLFRAFLDPTMTYSCGIFEHGAQTMEEASVEKMDRACRKLDLSSGDRLLEIGTGWGSMAMHAAAHYGCRVTTTTISREQATLARERIEEAGLSEQIEVIERDYRQLDGTYDKLVSIEMVEAVGRARLPEFFRVCADHLAPDGVMLLQAITILDQLDAKAVRTRDWLKKHIFPGSCLLSVGAIQRCIAQTDMRIAHMEDIGPHYATTLREWRTRFSGNAGRVRSLGFDERFERLWTYYLCYCEGTFFERQCGDVQVLLAKPENRSRPYVERGPSVPLRAIAPR